MWNHTPSADTRLYNQDEPRRHHTTWKNNVQTTDSTQPNQKVYQTTTGTNGWYQTATYDSWLSGGPLDNLGNPFGFCEIQLWGAGYPNSRLAWNERYRVNAGAGAWQILATPAGFTGQIADNPWDDEIELVFYHLWHHEGRRARMGTAMLGQDYAHWHGFFELAQDLDKMNKLYKELKSTKK